MPKFFVDKSRIFDKQILIFGEDALHISHSLRMKPGESLVVSDKEKTDYFCRIVTIGAESVKLEIVSSEACVCEPEYCITLFQSLAKADKFEYIIQKAVELGVSNIYPVASARCIAAIDERNAQKKAARWQKIALEAAKQCGRGIIPEVKPTVSFSDALAFPSSDELKFICYEGKTPASLPAILKKHRSAHSRISFFVGPEGGYEESEISEAAKAGIPAVTLGNRILRCETAPGFVLSAISCAYEIK